MGSSATRSAALLASLAGCHTGAVVAPSGSGKADTVSNVARADYAGSAACKPCHAELFASWQRSPMHNMTRTVPGAAIEAPFGQPGAELQMFGDSARLELEGGERFVRIRSKYGDHRFRVTKVIGGHHREDYAGVEVALDGDGAAPIGRPHEERVLPVSYLLGPREIRYKGYSVMSPERPGLKPAGVWGRTCIFCHNSEPYLDDLLGAIAPPGTPPYQGEVVDALLPESLRAHLRVTDGAGFAGALEKEMARLGAAGPLDGDPARAAAQAMQKIRGRFDETQLLEVGIGCEACHGGCREHAKDPKVKPSFEPRAPWLALDPPAREQADRAAHAAGQVTRVCARCHQVLFSRYPWTWEGGTRREARGGANINSGEARDFLLGGCATRMTCVACHDPHAPDNQAKMRALDGPAGDAVCLRCHEKYRGEAALRAHAHHNPAGAGGRCIGCHMAKKNLSLEARLGRYHRIGSPDDPERVERDRPLECAACHVDQPVEELAATMERWWGKRYDRAKLRALYGDDLAVRPLVATLARGKPHEQAAAAAWLGEQGTRADAPAIAPLLAHPIPLVRWYARAALTTLAGPPPSSLDLHAPPSAIAQAASQWLALPLSPSAAHPMPVSPPSSDTDD